MSAQHAMRGAKSVRRNASEYRLRHRGPECVGWMFTFAAAAYDLVRIRNLNAVPHSRRLQTALRRPRSQQTFKTAGAMKMAIGKQATLFVELLFFRSLSA
jgi:hypothetical protein